MAAGWIKISRDITKHWLWSDAERLKWWLDLLLRANWEDEKMLDDGHLFILKRGQRLAFKSKELAIYAGQQFGELWASFLIG